MNTAAPAAEQAVTDNTISVGNCPTCNHFPTQFIGEGCKAVRFIDNGDDTVTDLRQGLMFSKATLNTDEVNHEQALKLCTELNLGGFADWRLPSIEELFLLADRTKSSPAIDTDAFPDTQSDWYWSSTITAWSSVFAWFVNFSGGYASYDHRDDNYGFVRAVRAVAPGQ